MGFWRRLFGGGSSGGSDDLKPQRLDYLNEALALERQGDYDAALTSYRLALRDLPNDARILQNMAIAFTKTRRFDEAIRHYRRALELDSTLDVIDSTTGVSLAKVVGTARMQARTGNLFSNPQTVQVLALFNATAAA